MPDQPEASQPNNQPRSQTIQKILDGRKPYRDKVRTLHVQLTTLLEKLKSIEQLIPQLAALTPPSENSQNSVSPQEQTSDPFAKLCRDLKEQLRFLNFLKRRYERETLNVAVVGRKRSGKSELLGRMSGLSTEVIPRRDTVDPCTGARSILLHREQREVTGTVYFHTEESMLEIIHLYWAELELPNRPVSLKAFIEMTGLPVLSSEMKRDGTLIEYYNSLEKYRRFLGALWTKYGNHKPLDIHEAQIKEYVTQPVNNPPDADAYKFLVVKEVKVFCKFPGQDKDVEGLGLIDLPGLGEATLGGSERVRETLEMEADVLLFVFRPQLNQPISDKEIQDTYKVCKTALDQFLPLKEWAYLVINHQANDRLDNTMETKEAQKYVAKQKTSSLPTMLYRHDTICDVTDSAAVKQDVLAPLLKDMMAEIGKLDAQFGQRCIQNIAKLQIRIGDELNRVAQVLNISPVAQMENMFFHKFDAIWGEISEAMTILKNELEANVEVADKQFENLVKDLLRKLRNELTYPSEKEAQSLLDRVDGFGIAYDICRHRLRAQITKHLQILDQELLDTVNTAREKVVAIILDKGKLSELLPDPKLKEFALLMQSCPEIFEAINYLDNFHLSARSIVGYKIWPALVELEPRKQNLPTSGEANHQRLVADLYAAVDTIIDRLEAGLKVAAEAGRPERRPAPQSRTNSGAERGYSSPVATVWQGEAPPNPERSNGSPPAGDLTSDYSIPNRCAYAIVAEFRDRVIFNPEAENEWRSFYSGIRNIVWKADFQIYEDTKQLRQELLNLINEARALNQDVAHRFV